MLRRRPLREINFEKRKSLKQYFFLMSDSRVFRPNFKAIHQILIPYKFIQRWNTRVKTKSVFCTSKGLETFTPLLHHMSTLWLPQMPMANRNAQDPCRVPRGSAQDSISLETCSVCDYNSRSISLRYAGQEEVFQAEENLGISSGFNICPS